MQRIVLGLLSGIAIIVAGCSSSSTTASGPTPGMSPNIPPRTQYGPPATTTAPKEGALAPKVVEPPKVGAVTVEKLAGVWKVAKMNGQPPPKEVVGLTFEFTKDGKFKMSGPGKEEEGTYKLDGNKIMTFKKGGEKDDVLNVKLLTANTLVISNSTGEMEVELTK